MNVIISRLILIVVVFFISKILADKSEASDKKVWRNTFITILVISLYSGLNLGSHHVTGDEDSAFGINETQIDYEPTLKEQIHYTLLVFLCLIIPASIGILIGLRTKNARIKEESSEEYKRHMKIYNDVMQEKFQETLKEYKKL